MTKILSVVLLLVPALAAQKPRARDLGVPFSGTAGPANRITDVPGVAVGQVTIIEGANVRTGVTAIWPRGAASSDPVFGGWFSANGNGEMTGTAWLDESGFLDGPVMITNTHSVGIVRDAVIEWQVLRKRNPGTNNLAAGGFWSMPVVAETFDGYLNDVNGFHVKPHHVFQALDRAGDAVLEGNAGGGTGMVCFGFKGGTGTSSRRAGSYTVGALVQCNCGRRGQLRVAGVPVGEEPATVAEGMQQPGVREERGSIIIVVATDAPLLPHQLQRLARRATHGLARTGAISGNSSGDLFLAFSTANPGAAAPQGLRTVRFVPNDEMDPLFQATAESVEEAIINAMIAAETMTGREGRTVPALPHEWLKSILKKYGRLSARSDP